MQVTNISGVLILGLHLFSISIKVGWQRLNQEILHALISLFYVPEIPCSNLGGRKYSLCFCKVSVCTLTTISWTLIYIDTCFSLSLTWWLVLCWIVLTVPSISQRRLFEVVSSAHTTTFEQSVQNFLFSGLVLRFVFITWGNVKIDTGHKRLF